MQNHIQVKPPLLKNIYTEYTKEQRLKAKVQMYLIVWPTLYLIIRIKLLLKSCRLQKGDKNVFAHNVYGLELKA